LTFFSGAAILRRTLAPGDWMTSRTAQSPVPLTPEPAGWQAQKSASTRLQIVEAALRCFVEHGYGGTTTTEIIAKAGLSRGAMLHHFPTKTDVVRAAVEHLHAKRLKAFRKAIDQLPHDATRARRALEAYLDHVRHPLYAAFLELWIAARTDPELRSILQPAHEAFEREWNRIAQDLWPESGESGASFDLVLDLVRCMMDGIAVRGLTGDLGGREQRIVSFLEARLSEPASLRPGAP